MDRTCALGVRVFIARGWEEVDYRIEWPLDLPAGILLLDEVSPVGLRGGVSREEKSKWLRDGAQILQELLLVLSRVRWVGDQDVKLWKRVEEMEGRERVAHLARSGI